MIGANISSAYQGIENQKAVEDNTKAQTLNTNADTANKLLYPTIQQPRTIIGETVNSARGAGKELGEEAARRYLMSKSIYEHIVRGMRDLMDSSARGQSDIGPAPLRLTPKKHTPAPFNWNPIKPGG